MTHPLLAAEFPAYDQATLPIIPAGFEDESYSNDACPSFRHEALGLTLWIDFPKREDRELEADRFNLHCDYRGEREGDEEGHVAAHEQWLDMLGAIRLFAAEALKAGRVTPEQIAGLQG